MIRKQVAIAAAVVMVVAAAATAQDRSRHSGLLTDRLIQWRDGLFGGSDQAEDDRSSSTRHGSHQRHQPGLNSSHTTSRYSDPAPMGDAEQQPQEEHQQTQVEEHAARPGSTSRAANTSGIESIYTAPEPQGATATPTQTSTHGELRTASRPTRTQTSTSSSYQSSRRRHQAATSDGASSTQSDNAQTSSGTRPSRSMTAHDVLPTPPPRVPEPPESSEPVVEEVPHTARAMTDTILPSHRAAQPASDPLSAPAEEDPSTDLPDDVAAAPAVENRVTAPTATDERETIATTEPAEAVPPAEAAPAAGPAAADGNVLLAGRGPQLSVETSGPRQIAIGRQAQYQLTLRNAGDTVATDVAVVVVLPDWAEVAQASGTAGSTASAAEGEAYRWELGKLQPHSREQLTLKIVAHRSEPLQLGVQVLHAPLSSQAMVEVQEPKLQIDIAGPGEVVYGEKEVYRMTISNPGNGDAQGVMIHLLPITPGEAPAASHRLGTLKAGESKALEIELTARQSGNLVVRAEATADGGLKAAGAADVVVRRAELQVAIAGPRVHFAGQPAQYQLTLTNIGDAPASGIQLAAALPSGTELLSSTPEGQSRAASNEVLWSVERLEPGATHTVSLECRMTGSGSQQIEALALATGDLKHSAVAVTQLLARADLDLEVTDTPGPVPVEQEVIYQVRVRNRGTKSAEAIDVVAFFSDGMEPLGVDGIGHAISPGMVAFHPIAAIGPGEEKVYKIRAKATAGGNHRFRIELSCDPLDTKLTHEDTTFFYGEDLLNGTAEETTGQADVETSLRPAEEQRQ